VAHSLASASSIACSFLHTLAGNISEEEFATEESEEATAAAAAEIDDDHRSSPTEGWEGREVMGNEGEGGGRRGSGGTSKCM
jgi:hypothetical protein